MPRKKGTTKHGSIIEVGDIGVVGGDAFLT